MRGMNRSRKTPNWACLTIWLQNFVSLGSWRNSAFTMMKPQFPCLPQECSHFSAISLSPSLWKWHDRARLAPERTKLPVQAGQNHQRGQAPGRVVAKSPAAPRGMKTSRHAAESNSTCFYWTWIQTQQPPFLSKASASTPSPSFLAHQHHQP